MDSQTTGLIVFGVLARNCSKSLSLNIPRLEKAGEQFGDYRVLVYENDSDDGTDDIIRQWAERNEKVVGICEVSHRQTIPGRTKGCPYPMKSVHRIERMAGFRNRVLSEVESRFSPRYFCFVDVDILSFDYKSLAEAVCNAPDGWGGLFANGRVALVDGGGIRAFTPFQYDSYAFLANGVNPEDTGGWYVSRFFHGITSYAVNKRLGSVMYLPCGSAFNGIGIYRWEAIWGLRYRVEQTVELKRVNACFCEHVPFNADVRRRGYGLYIASDMETVCMSKPYTAVRRVTLAVRKAYIRIVLALSSHKVV